MIPLADLEVLPREKKIQAQRYLAGFWPGARGSEEDFEDVAVPRRETREAQSAIRTIYGIRLRGGVWLNLLGHWRSIVCPSPSFVHLAQRRLQDAWWLKIDRWREKCAKERELFM